MAKIGRIEVTVDLLKLVQGEIVLPELRLAQPDLLLETRADGPPNWQFGEGKDTTAGPPPCRASVGWRSAMPGSLPRSRQRTEPHRRAPTCRGPHRPRLKLNASGKVQGERLDLDITGAALAQLENGAEPYPASLALKLGQSDLHGDLSLDLFKEMPVIRAKFASDRVVTTDFTALFERQQRVYALEKPSGDPERTLEEVCPKPERASAAPPSTQPATRARCRAAVFDRQAPRSGPGASRFEPECDPA